MNKRKNEKEKIENKIIETIKKYDLIKSGEKVVIGVSGGPDSICLLDNLNRIRKKNPLSRKYHQTNLEPVETNFEIVVAHINHMIREEAKQDEQYVKEYCKKNDIEFYAKSIDVQKMAHTNKIGTEEAGRIARYQFFDEILHKTEANKIAVAHNKNDKIETILMNTLRGSGMEGLRGIEPKRGKIIRPLIECERTQIETYCEERQLNPRIDKTNFENIYNRNKIRNVVIPYIQEEFNPNIITTIDRLSDIITLENEYMEKQTQNIYQKLVIEEKEKEIIINLKSFNSQEIVIKSRLVRYIIKRLLASNTSIEKIHIEDIIKLCNNNIGNKYLTPNKNMKVLVRNHKIYFISQR